MAKAQKAIKWVFIVPGACGPIIAVMSIFSRYRNNSEISIPKRLPKYIGLIFPFPIKENKNRIVASQK